MIRNTINKILAFLLLGGLMMSFGCSGGQNDNSHTGSNGSTNSSGGNNNDNSSTGNIDGVGGEDGPVSYVPDENLGFTGELPMRYVIDTFTYGVQIPYDRYDTSGRNGWYSHFWTALSPNYSYTPNASAEDIKYKSVGNWDTVQSKNDCNYWTIYPSANGVSSGKVGAEFSLFVPQPNAPGTQLNYLNLSDYEFLYLDFESISSTGADVSFSIFIKDDRNSAMQEVYSYEGDGARQVHEIEIAGYDVSRMQYLYIVSNVTMSSQERITNKIYSIEAKVAETFYGEPIQLDDITLDSEYLGNLQRYFWGSYSASGFYDRTDKKWKLYFGAATPELTASDAIWYTETDDLSKAWSKPVAINLIDPAGKLNTIHDQSGYGGDPGIVKKDGVYYMYFSALEKNYDWRQGQNRIYYATSTDGINFTLGEKIVDCHYVSGNSTYSYGAGAPSVLIVDGVWYMYYYTSRPELANGTIGLCRKTSTDGIHWGAEECIIAGVGTADVKYIESLDLWVMTYYTDEGNEQRVQIGISNDGVNWVRSENVTNDIIAQNPYSKGNHNSGFIGNEVGGGYETMFVTYGVNDYPLGNFNASQMDTRNIEWSRITFSK